jgi:hypothetical protein
MMKVPGTNDRPRCKKNNDASQNEKAEENEKGKSPLRTQQGHQRPQNANEKKKEKREKISRH